jgi:hypothetical protein
VYESSQQCKLFVSKASSDAYGCEVEDGEYSLPAAVYVALETSDSERRGHLLAEVEAAGYPMLAMLLTLIHQRQLPSIQLAVLSMMRRGTCTFVEKARLVSSSSSSSGYGILVNNEEVLADMPSGKESTSSCQYPFSSARESDAHLIHSAAYAGNEILAVIKPSIMDSMQNDDPCNPIQSLIDELLDHWPHSLPAIALDSIISAAGQHQNQQIVRSVADEGGRIAVSGANGWAYFDYHLAMFGPQVVPLGPLRLQMAFPPHGCDASQYTVRIKDTIVAILRGGGCSFGIKVINAQKLGARAVMIVNTDDQKTMRLMALPDETPLINIPCIMVSRRIQYYLEEVLRRYPLLDNHLLSIQPMLYLSDYEKKNTITLPKRM